jgi:endonuclease-3
MAKETFDMDVVMERVAEAVRPFPKAAMFELAEKGHDSPFEQLIGCLLSIRTYDEVSLPVSLNLLARARKPAQMAKLDVAEIAEIIRRSSFSERKAAQIKAIAEQLVAAHGGELPCDRDLLLSFSGVGPKCANLTLGIACDQKVISVDIHVHRICNRWGYVADKTPEKTMDALQAKLPEKYWIEINRLLVPFGKHICTASRPHCSTCQILAMCQQVGVEEHR